MGKQVGCAVAAGVMLALIVAFLLAQFLPQAG